MKKKNYGIILIIVGFIVVLPGLFIPNSQSDTITDNSYQEPLDPNIQWISHMSGPFAKLTLTWHIETDPLTAIQIYILTPDQYHDYSISPTGVQFIAESDFNAATKTIDNQQCYFVVEVSAPTTLDVDIGIIIHDSTLLYSLMIIGVVIIIIGIVVFLKFKK